MKSFPPIICLSAGSGVHLLLDAGRSLFRPNVLFIV
jgi:hypothetical protein